MTPVRYRRLVFTLSVIIGGAVAAALVVFALGQNINLFFTPTDVEKGLAPINRSIRVGGMVKEKSLVRGDELELTFMITDYEQNLEIRYKGILPDLFREGQGIVANGRLLDNQTFQADEILAKHDEKYMPPEITASLKTKSIDNNDS